MIVSLVGYIVLGDEINLVELAEQWKLETGPVN